MNLHVPQSVEAATELREIAASVEIARDAILARIATPGADGGPDPPPLRPPDGFNVGANVGAAGGQSVFHLHVHVIPRWEGDVANPRGGVRGVIPMRRDYRG